MIILISISAEPVSGWGTLTYNYAYSLWKRRTPFVLFLPRSAAVPDVPFASHIRRVLPDLPLTFAGPAAFFSARRLWHAIPYVPPSDAIVHALIDFPYAVLGYRFACAHRLPFIMNAIGTYSVAPFGHFPDRQIFMPVYRHAGRIVAISQCTKERMIAAAGIARSVDVIYLPVERPVPEGREDFSILDQLPPGRRHVLTVSSPRIRGRKGFDILFEAFSSIIHDFPDAHLVAVGGVAAATPACTVFSRVSPAELAALYSRSTLFAAAPRSFMDHFEGYGLVYREAGLYGKPVIGTYSGGVPEAVEDGVTGLLVPENDPEAMAVALRRLLADPSLAARLGNAGQAAASSLTWDAYMDRFSRLYAEARAT